MIGKLGLIALESAQSAGKTIDSILSEWRGGEHYLIPSECPRFGTGEAKGIIKQSVRDKDIYILVDVCNYALTYKMFGEPNRMSPDDHYQDLKRVISACNGKAARITVIMPFLYESRQHRKTQRESLDCAVMLHELESMGVHSVVTFDAHDPRMQNVVPFNGLENVSPALQLTECLLSQYNDLQIDGEHMMFIAPDEGATERVVFLASLFGVNIGMFYKRRDYTKIVDGMNPIIAHEFCGGSVENMDVVVVDDMISSGGSMLDVARQLKLRGAHHVFLYATFGLFTNGFDKLDKAYAEGWFDKLFCTNLTYQKIELLEKEYFYSIDMTRYVAAIIDRLNQGDPMQELMTPAQRIKETVQKFKECRKF